MTSPTLVLLPGMDGTGRLFDRVRAPLQRSGPVTVVSYPRDQTRTYTELRALVESSIPAATDYVLVAESFSGPIAIEHTTARPPRLRAVVLSTSFAANPLPCLLRRLGVVVGAARLRLPSSLVRLLLVGRDAPSDLVEEVRAAVDSVRPDVLVDRFRQILAVDVRSRLAAVGVPVLYLAGRRDRLVGARGLRQCARHAPRFESVVLDGPHLLLQRRPAESAEAIVRFVAEVHGQPVAADDPSRRSVR